MDAVQDALVAARMRVSDARLNRLVDEAASRIAADLSHRALAFAWSGGKDSQAIRYVAELAGVRRCMTAETVGLEWPAMQHWMVDNQPPGSTVVQVPLDLWWLQEHPEMLFPHGPYSARWFAAVQHKGQRQYAKRHGIRTLLLGRRRADRNYCGPRGHDSYTDKSGLTLWSPLAAWTDDDVLALIARERLPLPPCYGWPRGFQVGTGPWPARQWTSSPDHGWSECWQIDADVVRGAAEVLPAAADWMTRTGKS